MSRRIRGKGAYGLVKARYIRNTSKKTGRHVTGHIQRVVYYNVYGNPDANREMRQRGPIYDENGAVQNYTEYKAWAIGQSGEHPYSYRVIISPKGKILSDTDFIESIQATAEKTEVGNKFRVVIHRDTDHTHAHLIFQADRTMSRKELEAWKAQVRTEMIAREEDRAKELGIKPPRVGEDDKEDLPDAVSNKKRGGKAVTDDDTQQPKQNGRRRRRRSRAKNYERSTGLG